MSEEAKILIETEEYVNSFTASMMEATFAWSNGAKFSEVCFQTVKALPLLQTRITIPQAFDVHSIGK